MDHHTVAIVSISGSCLDVLGSLYLAYDLLGGRHGPLRLLTWAVTYSIVFGIGYGVGLGLVFGFAAGIATGVTISVELSRAARGLDHYSLPWEAVCSAIRGAAFAAGLYPTLGLRFATAFAALVTAGQVFAYSGGMRPATDYAASRRPRLTRLHFLGTGGPNHRIHNRCTSVWRSCPPDRPHLVFCDPGGASDRPCHRHRHYGESFHRILRRQSPGAAPGSLWHRVDPLRLRPAIASVLAGAIRCPPQVDAQAALASRPSRSQKLPLFRKTLTGGCQKRPQSH